MYIEQAYKGFHEGWRYVVGIMSIFIGWQVVGMLPLMGTLITKSKGQVMPTDISGMAALLGSNLFLFLMLLSFAFGLLATFLTVKLVHKQKIVDLTTSRKRVDWNRVGFAFLLWAIISIIMVGADLVFSPEDYVFNFKLEPFLYLLVIGVLLIPIQTSCEEYLMRGYLMQGIGILAKNRWVPLVITSLIFGLLHLGNPEVEKLGYGLMVYYIGTGLF
jgi:membrane protease YdiL (CAAX protease family)